MEQTWKVSGTYFDWELTVRVTPSGEAPEVLDGGDPGMAMRRMKRVGRYFTDVVNLHEYALQCEG